MASFIWVLFEDRMVCIKNFLSLFKFLKIDEISLKLDFPLLKLVVHSLLRNWNSMKSSYEYQERQPFYFYSIKLGFSPQTGVGVNFNPLKCSNTKSYKIELSAIVTNIGLTLILASSTNRCGCHKARHYKREKIKLSTCHWWIGTDQKTSTIYSLTHRHVLQLESSNIMLLYVIANAHA